MATVQIDLDKLMAHIAREAWAESRFAGPGEPAVHVPLLGLLEHLDIDQGLGADAVGTAYNAAADARDAESGAPHAR